MGNLGHPEDHPVTRVTNMRNLPDIRAVKSPDVRWEKVESLRRAIAAGGYNPSARAIADAMLRAARK